MFATSAPPTHDTHDEGRPRQDWVVDMRSRRIVRRTPANDLMPEPAVADKEGFQPSNP